MSEADSINLSKLRSYVGNNESDVKDMINLFLQLIPQQKEKLLAAVKEHNWKNLNYTSHQIKPSLDILGLTEAKEKARIIESLSKTGMEAKMIKQLVEELSHELEDVCKELKTNFVSNNDEEVKS